ncbi:MAG: HD domain-containing protein [Treponema sp.]|jgi:nicotinate-nucleotide adenylyltransferase|nr:HD domain-containing protein [Treponema sp.]
MKAETILENKPELELLISRVTEYAENHEKKERFAHSVRTAETCVKLCRRFGLNERKGYFVGIAHDICKECDDMQLVSLAVKDGLPISELERTKISLLHGRAAAILLKEEFNIKDDDIIEAVRYHTFGKAGMGSLAKILYVADKIEPGRKHITRGYLEKIEEISLDELVLFVLSENISYLKAHDKKIAPSSKEFLESLVS